MTHLPAGDVEWLQNEATREEAHRYYDALWDACKGTQWAPIAELGRADRYFLLTWLCGRRDAADRDWIYQRCREVEKDPDGYLDLWAREHYKSTIITFAGIIQDILKNPEVTIGLFSYNATNARKFASQVKREFESNGRLKAAYPDVLFDKPEKQSPIWSEEKGIVVKRKGNPKEATLTPHGLIEGLPAGPHYDLRYYDDIITENEVTSPEMMEKAMHMWRQSQNLGKEGGKQRHAGTIYHFNDPHAIMRRDNLLKTRVYPATIDGTPTGKPVLVSPEYMAEKYQLLGPYVFSAQWLLNPVADEAQGFKKEWVKYWTPDNWESLNRYILCDPANEKKKHSDYTVFWVVGLGADRNYYVIDCVRDRLNLTERADALFALHQKYRPLGVGYEKYGIQADIEHFEDRQRRENYRFGITPLGGNVRKEDRIRAMIPAFQQGRMWFPECVMYRGKDGRNLDLIRTFIEQEMIAFPVSVHDDMLDSLARVFDAELGVIWPKTSSRISKADGKKDAWERKSGSTSGTWMSQW